MREPGADDEAWRNTYAGMQTDGSSSCPSEERLAALALGQLEEGLREELLEHVVSCRRCASRLKDLMELHRETQLELRTPARRRGLWLGAAAAVLIAAVGLPLVFLLRTERAPAGAASSSRGESPDMSQVEPPDRATLAEPPARFAWTAVPDAEGYQVVLFDFESTPVWEGPSVSSPQVDVPESVRAAMHRGSDYYWRVTAVVAVDRRPSALHRFHLAP